MIHWGMQGKSVPRQERNGSERAQVASVASEEAPREPWFQGSFPGEG